MTGLLIVSFISGVLTVLAPCILPLLPVIVGGGMLHGTTKDAKPSLKHPAIIVISLAVSIILFSLLLKATTAFLTVPTFVWAIISGGIVLFFGITLLFPFVWEKVMVATGFQAGSSRLMARSQKDSGITRDVLLGASLGPVFNSCSPTYALIIAVILPVSFGWGLIYLIAYAAGLASILMLLSIFGSSLVAKLRWMSDPNGLFKKVMGCLFIVVGFAVVFGLDKTLQTYVLDQGWYDPIMKIEEYFRR